MSYAARIVRGVLPLLPIVALGLPRVVGAQGEPAAAHPSRQLSLDEAVRLAYATSEAIAIARAGVDGAGGERRRASGTRLPRVAAFSSFDRTIRSEFDGLALGEPDAGDEPALPFGSPTTYRAGLSLTQPVFTGGRTLARGRAATSGQRAAELALTSARAQAALDVAEAYFDAALSEQLVGIVDATLAQAESTLHQAALLFEAGRGSEFDYLRAKVARDRQRPVVTRQRGERDVAMLRLKQLVHVPADTDLDLTTGLDLEPAAVVARAASMEAPTGGDGSAPGVAGRSVADYAAVREGAARLHQREQLLTAARAQRWPGVALTSSWERVAYSRGGIPAHQDFRTNWTVGARVDLPLLAGGQRAGDEVEADAALTAARAELRRIEQLAEFDGRAAAAQLATAEAAWAASEGAVHEAARAHEIAVVRHREGLAIQLELADARLALEAARAERARAARDLLVARLRATLLPDLPSAGRSGGSR